MEFVLTPEQMAHADRATIEAGTPQEVLMERAGHALARTVLAVLGGTYGRRVTLVCGKGNNGGDGLVAARVLDGHGVRTEVFRLAATGFDLAGLERALDRSHVAVDAVLGTGFRGALDGSAADAVRAIDDSGIPVVACDIPTGVDGLTGAAEGVAVQADVTVTFAALKPGLLLQPGAAHSGEVVVAPIGVDPTQVNGEPAYHLDGEDIAQLLPRRPPSSHKWAVGGLFVVAGQPGMLGAAQLVARSALRAGVGIAVLGLPGRELAARAGGGEVITRPLADTPEGFLDEAAAKEVLDGLERFHAVVVGPGLGTDERTASAVRRIVAGAPVPVLLDADGLNAFGGDLDALHQREGATLLTPHDGEFARLAGQPVGRDRLGAARELARRAGAVVLLKGPTTVVAEPGGRAVLNTTGGPRLASAGTGDVLAGLVGGLLAQGLDAFEAAAVGCWLHGRAAGAAGGADVGGPSGLIAGDLVEALPAVLAHPSES